MKIYLALMYAQNCYINNKEMEIYLAQMCNQNQYIDESKMKIYLAGLNAEKKRALDMNIYLAGNAPWGETGLYSDVCNMNIYMLESFYYIKDWQIDLIKKKVLKGFMLDSGAFTFMQDKNKVVDWDKYVEDYAKFINKYDIKLFFELDIDLVVGLKEVERLRIKLEKLTSKQCIPVWHKLRGKEYFLQMIKDYNYVAIGGLAIKVIKRTDFKYLHWFIKKAHENNCKIHGLGFTPSGLKNYRFDSVDSKNWIHGNLGKYIYNFRNKNMTKIALVSDKKFNPKKVAQHNFLEWIKYQKYAEKYL